VTVTLPPDGAVDLAVTIPADPPPAHPAGLTWVVPAEQHPIVIGPSTDHPELHSALDLRADRFWSGARHGLAVGRARVAMDDAAIEYALSADMHSSSHLAAGLADAATAWARAAAAAAHDMTGALS
jgi:hypothetical protein